MGVVLEKSVEVGRIRLGPFLSLAFGVYVLLCIPLAFIARETLTIGGLPWLHSVLAGFVGVYGTVDLGGAKLPTLGEGISRLEDSIAASMGRSISERTIAESAEIVATLAGKFTADQLEEELVQLGVPLGEIRATRQQASEDRFQRRLLASDLVRRNLTYSRTLVRRRRLRP